MSKDRELKIIIKADGSVAVNEIKVVAQSTDELEKQLKEARLEMARLEGEFDKVVGKTKSADTEINKLKTDSAALKNENKQLASELQRVQSALTEATTRVRGLEGQLTSATKDVKSFETSWSDLATGVNQALDILGKVKRYAEQAYDFARQGAQLREAKDSFDNYARSVGKSSDEILTKLRQASGGTIDDMNLIKTASLAMSLGVTQDAGKMANLLEVARNKGRLFGISTQQAFEDIVTGIGRASPKILDNLGIRIPAAFEKMTEGMTDAEKVAKLFELTLEEGNRQIEGMGGLVDSGADSFRQLETSWSNLKAAGGELISIVFVPLNVILAKTFDLASGIIDKFNDIYQASIRIKGPYEGISDSDLLKTYDKFKLDAANKKAEIESARNPANSFRQSEDGMSEAARVQMQLELKFAEQNAQAIEREMKNRSKVLIASAKSTAEKAYSAITDVFGGIIPTFSGEASAYAEKKRREAERQLKEIGRQADKIKAETEKIFSETNQAVLGGKQITGPKDAYKQLLEATYAAAGLKQVTSDVYRLSEGYSLDDYFSPIKDGKINDALTGFYNSIKDIPPELKKFNEEMESLAENKKALEDVLDTLKNFSKFDFSENLSKINPFNLADQNYAASMTAGMANFFSGGLLTTDYSQKFVDVTKKDKDRLSKTIAEAVSAGFANADFSNLELTLGNVLSSILTKSVSQSNPVISSAGAINWGNLGINLAASAVSNVLTRSGRFFGGREEHGKEAIQQASDLKSRMGQTYVDSYVSEITSIYATRAMKDAISNARLGYYGTSTGYTWSDSGDGIFSDRTRTYSMIDNGASAALKKLTDAVKAAETFSENEEAWINLQAAKGYEFGALQAKVKAYEETLTSRYYGQFDLRWSDGTVNEGENLTKLTREIEASLAEMKRELALATAERSTNAAAGFAKYAPWLQNIAVPIDRIPNTVGGTTRPGPDFYSASVAGLSRDSYYDAFESLQNNLSDRNISSGLIDMVKEAGTSRYELESLKFTDNDAYQEQYLAYVDRQISAYEEILERQEAIFADESKAYEERVAALEAYEQNLEAYHQAKLDKLRLEKAQEEEEKRLMAEQRQNKIEGLLSWVGEVNQQGNKVVVLYGNDTTAALEELMAEHADDPQLLAVLSSMLDKNKAKARWG